VVLYFSDGNFLSMEDSGSQSRRRFSALEDFREVLWGTCSG
jgi:hypothetical protein